MFKHGIPIPVVPGIPGSADWSTLKKLIWLRGSGVSGLTPVEKTAIGNPIHLTDALARAVKSLKVEFEPVQSGSGDPSPDNVRPISGWTGANVWRTGKNLLNDVNPTVLNAYFATATVSAENQNQRIVVIPCTPSTTYTFTWNRVAISGTQNARVCSFSTAPTYGTVGSIMAANVAESGSATFTTGANDHYIGIHMADIRTTDFQASLSASMLELGSTATAYEPYQGNSYSVTWQDEAGTVYGGYLTVAEDGSVTLTVDRAMVDLGSLTWLYATDNQFPVFYANKQNFGTALPDYTDGVITVVCSALKAVTNKNFTYFANGNTSEDFSVAISSTGTIQMVLVRDSQYTTTALFKTAMNGVQLCYKLATPVTYNLSDVSLVLLQGENNIWSDMNGDLDLTYYADGNVSDVEALNTLLGGRYVNNHTAEDVSDDEALDILLGGQR